MRAVVLTKHGPPEVLRVEQRPDPAPPGAGEVTVAIAATGIAFSEVAARVGMYPPAPKPPTVLGTDIAGTVAAVGDGVDSLATGDRVFGVTRYGGYAERVNTLADNLRVLPARLSFEQGAAISINYATAWLSVVSYGAVDHQPGARVLVHAAAGGVGIAATQIAKRHGAEVWGTASASKHDAIRGFGVDHAVDYRVDGWERELPKFDLVLDPIGGSNWRKSYGLLRPGGRTVNYGASTALVDGRRSLPAFVKAAVSHAAHEPDQADVRLEVRDRPDDADPLGRPRLLRAVPRAAAPADRGRDDHPRHRLQLRLRPGTRRAPAPDRAHEHRQGRAHGAGQARARCERVSAG